MSTNDVALATAISPTGRDGLWARAIAGIYDPFLWLGERAGVHSHRGELLAQARGRVLEIGAGTGLNLAHYPATVEELVLTEPEEPMARRLEARLRATDAGWKVLRAAAEAIPAADNSVDTVVSTMVLCTVDDPHRAADEIRRVLRPGGALLFIEHVRSERRLLGRLQDMFKEPWRRFARNCHCNRRTLELLRERGFRFEQLQTAAWKRMPFVVRPLVIGHATIPKEAKA